MSRRSVLRLLVWLVVLISFASTSAAEGDPSRVLPAGQFPHDGRLGAMKNLDGYFPFTPAKSKAEWEARAQQLRRQLLVATGLWPMPEKTPDNAVIHGRVDRDGYTVERVFFESFPGHFVTGSLFRPKGRSGKLPAVLCPHGHWANGRFYDAGPEAIRRSLVEGAERFEVGGRYPLQARCVQLARMGCVVFHYDMVGYADSVQLPHGAGYRASMSGPDAWGYFSPQAELRQLNTMGLQTYNSIRALDWLSQLPDIDPQRIAVTGASGGGTQSFMLAALDPRVAVAFPAVMVGTAMQGGCTCENACYLRVGTGNVEIAALIAPRPLGMTAADDWTKEILTKGLPELKQHYRMLGAENSVMAKALVHFPHNYNYVSRAVMYSWMNKHLKLGFKDPIVEEDFLPLSREELSVWDDKHPKPAGGETYERQLVRQIAAASDRQMQALLPTDAASLAKYREMIGGALESVIGRQPPKPGDVKPVGRREEDKGGYRLVKMLLRYEAENEEVPAILFEPKKPVQAVQILVDGRGKQTALDDRGEPAEAVRKALDEGTAVLAIDVFGTGEFTPDGKPLAKAPMLATKSWEKYLGYTLGYNPPLLARRVHDILSAISFARSNWPESAPVVLDARSGAGPWGAVARALSGGTVQRAAISVDGFTFARITALDDPDMLPGAVKYLDLPGILALSAPHELTVRGLADPKLVRAAYEATGHPDRLHAE